MAVTPNRVGCPGQFGGCGEVAGGQPGQQALDVAPVLFDQGPLLAPLGLPAEGIERRTAQATRPRQQPEQRQDRPAEAPLDQTALIVSPRQQRRRQVEGQRVVALELLGDAGQERRIAVQAGYFVLCLLYTSPSPRD